MNWKVIKSDAQYQNAVKKVMTIFYAVEGTVEAEELALLLVLIKDYEEKHIHLPKLDPLEIIK
jgi:HTH-type transcriptional regulator/antitoxin HigA